MHSRLLATILLSLAYFTTICTSLSTPLQNSGSQYIVFSGNISATVTYPPEYNCIAPEKYGPYARTNLFVGTNPSWDTNPFFFKLYHLASEFAGGFGFTNDTIRNLDFSSSDYQCFMTGSPCLSAYINEQSYFVPQVYLDMRAGTNGTKIEKTKIGEEEGYAISGANNWIGNGTQNEVDVDSGCIAAQFDWLNFKWNSTAQTSYNLSVTNNYASLTLRTSAILSSSIRSTLELTFSGPRNGTMDRGIKEPILLSTSNATMPEFVYQNGSEIFFGRKGPFSWIAAATPIPETSSASSGVARTSTSRTATRRIVSSTSSALGVENESSVATLVYVTLVVLSVAV